MSINLAMGIIMFRANTLHDIDLILSELENKTNPLVNIGYFGVEGAKEGWKLKKYISQLEKIRDILEEEIK